MDDVLPSHEAGTGRELPLEHLRHDKSLATCRFPTTTCGKINVEQKCLLLFFLLSSILVSH